METYHISIQSLPKIIFAHEYVSDNYDIFFDKTVVFKTQLAKLFMDVMNIDIDRNLVITACLLCNCKKAKGVITDLVQIRSYAKEGAKYLESLGFDARFCKICEEVNRYSGSNPRERESDILELVDQFGGMVMNRPERIGFKVDEALCLLENRNLKGVKNIYLPQFKEFVERVEAV